jgi:hypothetical protein
MVNIGTYRPMPPCLCIKMHIVQYLVHFQKYHQRDIYSMAILSVKCQESFQEEAIPYLFRELSCLLNATSCVISSELEDGFGLTFGLYQQQPGSTYTQCFTPVLLAGLLNVSSFLT